MEECRQTSEARKSPTRVVEAEGRRIRVVEEEIESALGVRFSAELRDYEDPTECAVVDGWEREQFAHTLDAAIRAFAAALAARKSRS